MSQMLILHNFCYKEIKQEKVELQRGKAVGRLGLRKEDLNFIFCLYLVCRLLYLVDALY